MAIRGRKPRPVRRGERRDGVPAPPDALPRCPAHLSPVARKEWRRLAKPLHDMGILTIADRGAFAAYCQAWARWVEAEEQLGKTPALLKTPSGYVQQSPWLSVANKQLELMGRYMAELGITPASRSRVASIASTRDEAQTVMPPRADRPANASAERAAMPVLGVATCRFPGSRPLSGPGASPTVTNATISRIGVSLTVACTSRSRACCSMQGAPHPAGRKLRTTMRSRKSLSSKVSPSTPKTARGGSFKRSVGSKALSFCAMTSSRRSPG